MTYRKKWFVLQPGDTFAKAMDFARPVSREEVRRVAGQSSEIWAHEPYMKPIFQEKARRGYSASVI